MKTKVYLFLILCFTLIISLSKIQGQTYTISGKVIDEYTKEPLAFVNIVANQGKYGVTSSIEGLFTIKSNTPFDSLRFSYVGYQPKTIIKPSANGSQLMVYLQPREFNLQEVIILPEENPAHRIINQTIANKNLNNPFKNSSFSYVSYNKMIFTTDILTDTATIKRLADSTITDSVKLDDKRTFDFFTDQHLFLMESVNYRIFKAPSSNYEKVIASKISGFKDPLFSLLITQIQGISFYDDMFIILDKKYVNPISKGSTSKYFFLMQDTLYQKLDTVFVISYRPRRNTNFDALNGLLYINTNGYAIQNVTAHPAREEGGISINIQQQYEQVDSSKWFPLQLNTEMYFQNLVVNNSHKIIAKGWTYIKEIQLNPTLKRRDFGNVDIDIDVVSPKESERLLDIYRIQPLSPKELKTYHVIDSIGKEQNLEKTMIILKTLSTGYYPVGIFDIALDKVLRYNEYEGFRLGFGAKTNRSLMKNISIGGYYAYAFSNNYSNYGGNIETSLSRKKELKFNLSYMYDVIENGKMPVFFTQTSMLGTDQFRNVFVSRFNHHEIFEASVSGKISKYTTLKASFDHQKILPGFNYEYMNLSNNQVFDKSNPAILSEFKFGIRYAYKERNINNGDFKFVVNADFPVLIIQYTRAFDNILESQYAFNRVDMSFQKTHTFKYLGKTSLFLTGGYTDKVLPMWGLHAFTSGLNKEFVFSANSFSSMPFNTYYASSHVSVFLNHNFGNLLFRSKKFEPEFVIHQNFCFGWLNTNQTLSNRTFKTPERGYFESGLMINNLVNLKFYTLGIGAFYHYGVYSSKDIYSNIAAKWVLTFPF